MKNIRIRKHQSANGYRSVTSLLFLILFNANAMADVWSDYNQQLRMRNYTQAARTITELANSGDPKACYELAQLYRNGKGVAQDETRARGLLQSAAKQGHVPSEYLLGIFFGKGIGGAMDVQQAQYWLQRAAAANHPSAGAALARIATESRVETSSDNQLIAAVKKGDIATVQAAISHKQALQRDNDGNSLLSVAAASGHPEIAALLLNAGVDINQQNRFGETALHQAVQQKQFKSLTWLLQHNANTQLKTMAGKTPLHLAVERNQTDSVELLLKAGASALITDKDQQSPLDVAEQRNDRKLLALFARYGFKPNRTGELDRRLQIARQTTDNTVTPLQLAVERDDLAVIQALLKNEPNPWQPNNQGQTLLTIAAQHSSPQTLTYLLDRAKGAGALGPMRRNTLFFALDGGNSKNLKLLLARGVSPLQSDKAGQTAVDYALQNHPELAQILIQSIKTDQWQSVWLPVAARQGLTKLCQQLIKGGVAIDTPDPDGNTALLSASKRGNAQLIELLVNAGASTDRPDAEGNTALHIAAASSPDALRALLRISRTSGLVNQQNRKGYTPLHLAASNARPESVDLLIASRANLDQRDNNGNTPLMLAILANSPESVKKLLAAGASTRKRNNIEQDALSIATQLGYQEIVQALKAEQHQGLINIFK